MGKERKEDQQLREWIISRYDDGGLNMRRIDGRRTVEEMTLEEGSLYVVFWVKEIGVVRASYNRIPGDAEIPPRYHLQNINPAGVQLQPVFEGEAVVGLIQTPQVLGSANCLQTMFLPTCFYDGAIETWAEAVERGDTTVNYFSQGCWGIDKAEM